jgi:antitoxin VapB
MGIFIKNPEVERKARDLARLRRATLTEVIGQALDCQLAEETAKAQERRRPTLEEMRAATREFRRVSGLDKGPHKPITKAEWDAMWPVGIGELDKA